MTEHPLDVAILAGMNASFSETALPFTVDVLDWAALEEHARRFVQAGSVVIRETSARP
jgi:type I restriction enzyme S subunit